jgi:hypothetical protein
MAENLIEWMMEHRRKLLFGMLGAFSAVIAVYFLTGTSEASKKVAVNEVPKWMKESLPYHSQYASATLLISKGQLGVALDEAKKLKKVLEGQKQAHKLLFAFNLLRIATLEKEVGTPEGELAAWNEVKGVDSDSYQSLQETFKEKSATLSDYIKHREESLAMRGVNLKR